MKKLYRKGTVHPSAPLITDQLAFLPATILTLTVALSPADREVLAYLLSCSSTNFSGNRKVSRKTTAGEHQTSFNCNCFRCYMSYWIRWDSSPNRQLIHEIIDAFEDGLQQVLVVQDNNKKDKNNKKLRRNKRGRGGGGGGGATSDELNRSSSGDQLSNKDELESVKESSGGDGDDDNDDEEEEEGEFEKGGVRKFVSSIGERIWSVWTL